MALGYACVATLVLLMTTLQTRWLFALVFWPTLWIVRAFISLLAKSLLRNSGEMRSTLSRESRPRSLKLRVTSMTGMVVGFALADYSRFCVR